VLLALQVCDSTGSCNKISLEYVALALMCYLQCGYVALRVVVTR
jgi:hypothetical protein